MASEKVRPAGKRSTSVSRPVILMWFLSASAAAILLDASVTALAARSCLRFMNDSIRPAHDGDNLGGRVYNVSQMSATAQAEPENQMGELARLTGVVWSPGTAFQDIAARPRW